jgi:hypothetical protein
MQTYFTRRRLFLNEHFVRSIVAMKTDVCTAREMFRWPADQSEIKRLYRLLPMFCLQNSVNIPKFNTDNTKAPPPPYTRSSHLGVILASHYRSSKWMCSKELPNENSV